MSILRITIFIYGGITMKKALLVGINEYQGSPLKGCVNDCLLMYKMLTEEFDFETKDIKLLTDHEATQDRILLGLSALTSDVQPGDTIYFHYSGHGSQVAVNDWTDNFEPDGRDEILCPVNLNWDFPLRDQMVGSFFKDLPKEVNVVVVLDCCHSGTGLRAPINSNLDGPKWLANRFLPPPPSKLLSNPLIRVDADMNFILPEPTEDLRSIKRPFLVDTVEQGHVILITGCQDNQTSADAYLAGTYRGALTYCLYYVLSKRKFNMSYEKLVIEINRLLDNKRYDQNPQLECLPEYKNRKFLG